jgi:hypothetical protein
MPPTKVEGVDYSEEGIEALREQLVAYRGASMDQWPEAIPFTVAITHAIALLAFLIETLKEQAEFHEQVKGAINSAWMKPDNLTE